MFANKEGKEKHGVASLDWRRMKWLARLMMMEVSMRYVFNCWEVRRDIVGADAYAKASADLRGFD
jgi:hypothetical protein